MSDQNNKKGISVTPGLIMSRADVFKSSFFTTSGAILAWQQMTEENKMKFTRYPSIDNVHRQKTIDDIYIHGFDKGLWTVSEKVHGANFSFYCNGDEVRVAKRSGFTDGGFYDCQDVIDKYAPKVMELFNVIGIKNKDEIVVRGELFGGHYPHPDLERKGMKSVQKGVHYCNRKEFVAFDLMINGLYAHKIQAFALIRAVDIPFTGSIFNGTFQECLDFNPKFNSRIPKMFGMPELEDNICEGVVIEPVIPQFFPSGSRVILKNKNEDFVEKSHARAPKKPIKLSGEAEIVLETLSTFVTESRLRNVLSHIGQVNKNQFGMILGQMVQDIMKDYGKDYLTEMDEWKRVSKQLSSMIADLIRPNFCNMVDGNF